MPGASYLSVVEELYSGQYRRALRGMQTELNGAVRTTEKRWIDSVCYHAMLGEILFQAGQNEPALVELDQAVLLFLENPKWLKSLNFQAAAQTLPLNVKRLPGWAQPQGPVSYGKLPGNFLMLVGRLDNSRVAQEGGTVELAQYWKIDAQEISRAIALAIYRRGVLLGPMAKHDRLQKQVIDTVSRGGLAPAEHWSNIWPELWWGMASASVGDIRSAEPHLRRAMFLLDGSQHDLTAMALMGQGMLAQKAEAVEAGSLLRGALSSAAAYQDMFVLGEVAKALTVQDVLSPGSVGPVDFASAADWVRRGRFEHTAAQLDLQAVERLLSSNQPGLAMKRLNGALGRRNDIRTGRLGAQEKFLAAQGQAALGDIDEANGRLTQAMKLQFGYSLRNFQIHSANLQLDDGSLSPRLALDAYRELLNDPTPVEWVNAPLDSMVGLRTDHTGALDRWFAVALSRRDTMSAFVIVDQQRRRRFFRKRLYAGRLDGMRRLLEAQEGDLLPDDLKARFRIEARSVSYMSLRSEGIALRTQVRAIENLWSEGGVKRPEKKLFQTYGDTIQDREAVLRQLALSRNWIPLVFPSRFDKEKSRKLLKPNEVLVVFHESKGEYYGLVMVESGENLWRIGSSEEIEAKVVDLLAATSGLSKDLEWTYGMLASKKWQEPAKELSKLLWDGSRVDMSSMEIMTIVPDGITWHLPWEVLPLGSETTSLIDLAKVRVSPTAGQALTPRRELPKEQKTLLIAVKKADEEAPLDPLINSIGETNVVYPGKVIPNHVLKGVVDRLVVDIAQTLEPDAPEELNPFLSGRRQSGDLDVWSDVPCYGPHTVVFSALGTDVELLAKQSERGPSKRRNGRPGDEMFDATCALLAGGARTVLISRWQTRGERSRELVAEFLVGLQQEGASGAWQRSVALARTTPLVIDREPRVVASEDDGESAPPDASHPFFWGGYLMVD